MNLFRSALCRNGFANLLGLVAGLFFFVQSSSSSASATGWSQQSAWSGGDSAPSRRASVLRDSSSAVSPFSPGSSNLALDVGQVFLISSDFADSIGAQVHYTYGVSDMFGFDSSFGYSDHSDSKFSMTSLLMELRTNLSWYDKLVPYVIFGLGFYKMTRQVTLTSSMSPVMFGVHVGPGVDLELTRQFFFGAALTFHDIFGTQKMTTQGPVDFGGTYTSFLLHVGVTF